MPARGWAPAKRSPSPHSAALAITGAFTLQTSVRTEVTGDALREILKEFADVRNRPVPAEELENAKRALSVEERRLAGLAVSY